MDNDIYRKTIVTARQSPDGESPTVLYVTQEVNGFGVFLTGYDNMRGTLVRWFDTLHREDAIEFGVNYAEELLIAQTEKKAA